MSARDPYVATGDGHDGCGYADIGLDLPGNSYSIYGTLADGDLLALDQGEVIDLHIMAHGAQARESLCRALRAAADELERQIGGGE